jgi:transcriptional regulator with XRE-family HTH domain
MSINQEKIDDFKIALLLRSARSILGWSLKDVADLLGVGASTVGKWESMQLSLKATTYIKLLKILSSKGLSINLCNSQGELEIKINTNIVALNNKKLIKEYL